MEKKKKLVITIGISSFVIVVAACLIFYFKDNPYPCPDSFKNDAAVECYGVISVDGYGEHGFSYSIYDNIQRYTIADIRKFKDFKFTEGKIYVIDQARDLYVNNLTKEYDKYYFVDGQIKNYSSKTKEGMPRFFIIDAISGNVSPYISIDQVPEPERPIFQDLER